MVRKYKKYTFEELLKEASKNGSKADQRIRIVFYEGEKFKSSEIEFICACGKEWVTSIQRFLDGAVCIDCTFKKRIMPFGEVLKRAKMTHGDNLNNYHLFEETYISTVEKMKIRCRKHNQIFYKKPYKFIRGSGCPTCSKELRAINQTLTWGEFSKRAESWLPEHISFIEETFSKGDALVKGICLKHGEFYRNALELLTKRKSCQKCSTEEGHIRSSKTNRIPFEEFVKRARAVFGNKYEYIESEYKGISYKTIVLCPDHGEFSINATDHTRGNPCPRCSFKRSRPERYIRALFEERKILFKEQFSFEGSKFRYDFYLSEIPLLIEYDGRHHFEPAFGKTPEKSIEVFEKTKRNDRLKDKLALDNKISLIRLNNERTLKKDIEEILRKYSK